MLAKDLHYKDNFSCHLAPEVFYFGMENSRASNIWSAGTILAGMFTKDFRELFAVSGEFCAVKQMHAVFDVIGKILFSSSKI